MWLAAWRAIPGRRFYDYAVLGDDLVIGHSGVAQEYLKIMSDIEVTISKEKSLISHSGALEFAKRYITDAGMRDLSPVSFRELNMFGGFMPAYHFKVLGVSYQTSIRLRGGACVLHFVSSFREAKTVVKTFAFGSLTFWHPPCSAPPVVHTP